MASNQTNKIVDLFDYNFGNHGTCLPGGNRLKGWVGHDNVLDIGLLEEMELTFIGRRDLALNSICIAQLDDLNISSQFMSVRMEKNILFVENFKSLCKKDGTPSAWPKYKHDDIAFDSRITKSIQVNSGKDLKIEVEINPKCIFLLQFEWKKLDDKYVEQHTQAWDEDDVGQTLVWEDDANATKKTARKAKEAEEAAKAEKAETERKNAKEQERLEKERIKNKRIAEGRYFDMTNDSDDDAKKRKAPDQKKPADESDDDDYDPVKNRRKVEDSDFSSEQSSEEESSDEEAPAAQVPKPIPKIATAIKKIAKPVTKKAKGAPSASVSPSSKVDIVKILKNQSITYLKQEWEEYEPTGKLSVKSLYFGLNPGVQKVLDQAIKKNWRTLRGNEKRLFKQAVYDNFLEKEVYKKKPGMEDNLRVGVNSLNTAMKLSK